MGTDERCADCGRQLQKGKRAWLRVVDQTWHCWECMKAKTVAVAGCWGESDG